MATKPTSFVRWGDVSGDIVEPTSGKKDVGWVPDERPPAQYLNWITNLVGQWQEYLSDLDFDGTLNVDGDITGTGAINLTGVGASSVDGDFDVAGALTVGSFATAAFTLDDGVNSDATLIAPTSGAASYSLTFPPAGPTQAARVDLDSSGNITLDEGFTVYVPATAGANTSGSNWTVSGNGRLTSTGGSTDVFGLPIQGLRLGWRIIGWRFIGLGTNASNNIEVHLMRFEHNPQVSPVSLGSASITGAGLGIGQQVIGSHTLGTPEVIQTDQNVFFEVRQTGGGSSTRFMAYLEVTVDYGA